MSWRDVELARELIARREPELSIPSGRIRIDLPYDPKAPKNTVGYTTFPFNRIRLSLRYAGELDTEAAFSLLRTLVHESIHLHSSLFERFRDFFDSKHPQVYARAEALARLHFEEFQALRRS